MGFVPCGRWGAVDEPLLESDVGRVKIVAAHHHPVRLTFVSVILGVLCLGLTGDLPEPQWMIVGTRYGNQVLVPSNQLLNPAGERIEFPGRPVDIALSPNKDVLAVLLPTTVRFFTASGEPLRTVRLQIASFAGLAFTPDGIWIVSSQLGPGGNHSIAMADVKGEYGVAYMPVPRNSAPTGIALDRAGANIYVALNRMNTLGRLEIATGEVVQTVPVGIAPFGVAITPQGNRLFVTNWGGRRPEAGELSAGSAGTRVLIDERGVASSGTVSVIDVASFRVLAEVPVGLHPSGIQISPDGRLAAIANANSDSLTLLDTGSLEVVDTIYLPAFPQGYIGSTPTAVAFSPGGEWLYVACSGNNAVAVLERQGQSYALRGFVPTDWYPVALAVSPSSKGDMVHVANSKGIGSRNATRLFRVSQALGTVNIFSGGTASIAEPDAVSFTNHPFQNATAPTDSPQNLKELGIEHVFLIIKENRTYDQVFGDLGQGNGDPNLTLYGWQVTPNQHELALQFATLDNFYTSGVVSADGHQWLTQAMVTDYIERAHAGYPRSYPFDGTDALAFAPSGFLWNNAYGFGLSVRIFGEFTVPVSPQTRTWVEYLRDSEAPVRQISERSRGSGAVWDTFVEPDYPAFRLYVPDVWRARVFLDKFQEYVRQGNLPNLLILQLPTDHTEGTVPQAATPAAMVADNDLATGRIVEAISRSPYWPRSAIFIVEDDAQDGVDHVDGHRTVCLVVSPYVRRGVVDSTHYNQTSVLRTIEELLGMPPMNKFDAAALPMRSLFVKEPDLRPFLALPNRIRLDTLNPPLTALNGRERAAAQDSLAMNFKLPDAAPEEVLNRILWHTARGWDLPYPPVPHGPDCPKDD